MTALIDKVLSRFGYVRRDDDYDHYRDDDYLDYVDIPLPEHEVWETDDVDLFKIHVGDPGPDGSENVSVADPEARVIEDFWGNDDVWLKVA